MIDVSIFASVILVSLIAGISWPMIRKLQFRWVGYLHYGAMLALAWHPVIWHSLINSYPGDSIHTLSSLSMAGLVVLSSFMALCLCISSIRKTDFVQHWHQRSHPSRLPVLPFLADQLLIIGLFWLALILVPQVYYAYYRTFFEGLPQRWVVSALSFDQVLSVITMSGRPSSTLHFSGWAIWTVLISSWLHWMYYIYQNHLRLNALQISLVFLFLNLVWQARFVFLN